MAGGSVDESGGAVGEALLGNGMAVGTGGGGDEGWTGGSTVFRLFKTSAMRLTLFRLVMEPACSCPAVAAYSESCPDVLLLR